MHVDDSVEAGPRRSRIFLSYARVDRPQVALIATTNEQSVGSAIDDIVLVAECMSEEEIRDQVVVFLPFLG